MKEKTVGVYCPSYRRSDCIMTQNILNDVTYVVRTSEEEAYRNAGVRKLISAPDEEINTMSKVRQWILDNSPEDIIIQVDDDIKQILYRTDIVMEIKDPDVIDMEFLRIAQLLSDLKLGYATITVTPRPYLYQEEFKFNSMGGGIYWYNKECYKAKNDDKADCKEDVDKILQELMHNRIILMPKYLAMYVKGDMGSYITQYYNNVIIAFNKNSKYVQINPGEIAIYNNGVSNSKKRAVFDQIGSHYWRDGYYVGKIGTNMLNSDNSKKGLNFDLEWPGAYMAWAAQDYSGASSYTMKWTYVQKNKGWSDYTAGRLHAGCDIDMHNWTLRNVSWPDGSINGTLRFVQIISMNSDGTAGQWSSNCLMQFKNGILIKGTWYG